MSTPATTRRLGEIAGDAILATTIGGLIIIGLGVTNAVRPPADDPSTAWLLLSALAAAADRGRTRPDRTARRQPAGPSRARVGAAVMAASAAVTRGVGAPGASVKFCQDPSTDSHEAPGFA
jgi:hypothetical protein